jgi:nitroimidazol reductase NimA-like FMN-containing flavoprotein (pyridoxamine 5'-phosphate oxidase superfamily)
MARQLEPDEISDLLNGDTVARLATVDADGYPHVTPIWFVWDGELFHLASDSNRPHLARITSNPKVGLVIDLEEPERSGGERPNRQVRVVGDAALSADDDGAWTIRIWSKYRRATDGAASADRLRGRKRVHVTISPRGTVAVASV